MHLLVRHAHTEYLYKMTANMELYITFTRIAFADVSNKVVIKASYD